MQYKYKIKNIVLLNLCPIYLMYVKTKVEVKLLLAISIYMFNSNSAIIKVLYKNVCFELYKLKLFPTTCTKLFYSGNFTEYKLYTFHVVQSSLHLNIRNTFGSDDKWYSNTHLVVALHISVIVCICSNAEICTQQDF